MQQKSKTPQVKHIVKNIIVFSAIFISLFMAEQSAAQQLSHLKVEILKDSLYADNDTKIVFNNISITNTGVKTYRVGVTINIPKGWKNLQDKEQLFEEGVLYTFLPGQVKTIPLNLIKQSTALANWQDINIKVWLWDMPAMDTSYRHVYIKTEQDRKYITRITSDEIMLDEKPEFGEIPVYIKNTGNVADTYLLWYQNAYLEIEEKISLKLPAGKDTNFVYRFPIRSSLWQGLYQQKINLMIKNDAKSTAIVYQLARAKSSYKQRRSGYQIMPIVVEGSMMSFNDRTSYFGGISGSLDLGPKDDVSFYYRSRQYGSMYRNFYQANAYYVAYTHDKWNFSVGRLNPMANYFLYTGLAAKVSYKPDENTVFSLSAHKHDPQFVGLLNDGVTAFSRYKMNKILVSHTAIVNRNAVDGTMGSVLENTAQIVKTKSTKFALKGGVSTEEQQIDTAGNTKHKIGYIVGYEFSHSHKDWLFTSNIDLNSRNVPGLYKGRTLQNHRITRTFNKFTAGVYYDANYIAINYFRDSLYNTDILKYNVSSYGLLGRVVSGKHQFTMTGGIMTNRSGGKAVAGGRRYISSLDYLFRHYSSQISFNSTNALLETGIITTNGLTVSSKYVGVNIAYTSTPVSFNGINNGTEGGPERIETITGGPNVNFYINKHISGSARYNFFKTTQDVNIRHGFGGAIGYSSAKSGLSIQMSGFYTLDSKIVPGTPIQDVRSAQISLIKRLDVPLLFARKYHELSAVLYHDMNNNGIRDNNEDIIPDAVLTVNDNTLKTNEKGEIRCRNIDNGQYSLGFQNTATNGLVPVNGTETRVAVSGNNISVEIPFKAGKIIAGRVSIQNDEASHLQMSPDNIKITATDNTGKSYVTLTGATGDFKMYVPAGIYTVALNKAAFEGSEFKPERMSFAQIDLTKDSKSEVQFNINKKVRKVRYVNSSE